MRGALEYTAGAGRRKRAFDRRINGRRLPAGAHWLTLTAISASGRRSRPQTPALYDRQIATMPSILSVLKQIEAAAGALQFAPPAPSCPISWQPNPLAPVFYGVRDYGIEDGAPGPCRVFFPSLDGSPNSAEILTSCGLYPLVLFAHGQCLEPNHYKKWYSLPATLARAGYVVAVPQLSASYPWVDTDPDFALLGRLGSWLRGAELISQRPFADRRIDTLSAVLIGALGGWLHAAWEYRSTLLPPPMTGVAGHSYGSLKAARLAAQTSGISAYASLSGPWLEWPEVPARPLDALTIPTLLTWGTGITDVNAQLVPSLLPPPPRHLAVFKDGEHWDYLPPDSACDQGQRGLCGLTPSLAADLVTMFFGRYLHPPNLVDVPARIPVSLIPPPLALSEEQQFFAGGWLESFSQLTDTAECSVTLSWEVGSESGATTEPQPVHGK